MNIYSCDCVIHMQTVFSCSKNMQEKREVHFPPVLHSQTFTWKAFTNVFFCNFVYFLVVLVKWCQVMLSEREFLGAWLNTWGLLELAWRHSSHFHVPAFFLQLSLCIVTNNDWIFQIGVFWTVFLLSSFTFLSIIFQHHVFFRCSFLDVIEKHWENDRIDAKVESKNVLERRSF